MTFIKRNVCAKILLHANIRARKAALKKTIFPGVIIFVSTAPLSHSAIFDQINTGVLLRRVNYLYLANFKFPIVFLYPVST